MANRAAQETKETGWETEAVNVAQQMVSEGEAQAQAGDPQAVSLSDIDLRGIDSFEAAQRLLAAQGVDVVDAEKEIGTGFTVLERRDKDRLVNVPFLILKFEFYQGDFTDPDSGEKGFFSSMHTVTATGEKFIVNDGGSGIYRQLDDFAARAKRRGGLLVKKGLRRSDFEHPVHGKAFTHYLNV